MSALLARLIDDAALFPPERAPMDEALPAHRAVSGAASRPAGRDPLVGRFLCPASRRPGDTHLEADYDFAGQKATIYAWADHDFAALERATHDGRPEV